MSVRSLHARGTRRCAGEGHGWRGHREKAPRLFLEELRDVVLHLRVAPTEGTQRYMLHQGQVIWRILMPKTRNHVYYRIDDADQVVEVLTVWNAVGTPPEF